MVAKIVCGGRRAEIVAGAGMVIRQATSIVERAKFERRQPLRDALKLPVVALFEIGVTITRADRRWALASARFAESSFWS